MSFDDRVREHWPDVADDVIGIVRGTKDPLDILATQEWVNSCYSMPKTLELKAHAINELIGGYGVEAIWGDDCFWPDVDYINMGDTYNTTILLDRVRNTWSVTTLGDWVEWAESKGRVYG